MNRATILENSAAQRRNPACPPYKVALKGDWHLPIVLRGGGRPGLPERRPLHVRLPRDIKSVENREFGLSNVHGMEVRVPMAAEYPSAVG